MEGATWTSSVSFPVTPDGCRGFSSAKGSHHTLCMVENGGCVKPKAIELYVSTGIVLHF
jgi:hypothetical protein